jgi:hypothetical protein
MRLRACSSNSISTKSDVTGDRKNRRLAAEGGPNPSRLPRLCTPARSAQTVTIGDEEDRLITLVFAQLVEQPTRFVLAVEFDGVGLRPGHAESIAQKDFSEQYRAASLRDQTGLKVPWSSLSGRPEPSGLSRPAKWPLTTRLCVEPLEVKTRFGILSTLRAA